MTGGDSAEQRRFGDRLDHDQRYARTDEFLSVVRGVWRGGPYDFHGDHHQVGGGPTALPPTRRRSSSSAAPRRRPGRSRLGTRTSI